MAISERAWLDLDRYVGARNVSYAFELIDGVNGEHRGYLHPARGSSPSLTHDATSTISRRLQGITLDPVEAALFRPLVDRIEVTMTIEGAGTYPLGRYMAADDITIPDTDGIRGDPDAYVRTITLYDEMLIVDQPMGDSFSANGLVVAEVMRDLLADLPIRTPLIEGGPQTCDSGWSAGTSRASVWSDLATAGGYRTPWFDHDNNPRCVRATDPDDSAVDIDLDTIPRVYRGTITVTDETPTAPNRYVVVSNDTGESDLPVVGIYDVPSSAPHSIANRGFVLPTVVDAQVTTTEQAQVYARTLGLQDQRVQRVEFSTPPDPRHDGYTVVRFLGERWVEMGWGLTLTPGGAMTHTLTRVYPRIEDE